MAQVTGMLLMSASLALAVDSVHVTPAKPTTRDPLTFELYNGDLCCVVEYYRDTAYAYDTTILLSYEYDDSLCPYVRCLVPGSRHEFRLDPVAAGTYGIYKLEQRYCPGPICPLGPIVQRRVGEVTVSRPTGVAAAGQNAVQPSPARARVRFDPARGSVAVVLPGRAGLRAGRCTIEGRVLRAPCR